MTTWSVEDPELLGLHTPLAAGCDFPRPHGPAATSPGAGAPGLPGSPGNG